MDDTKYAPIKPLSEDTRTVCSVGHYPDIPLGEPIRSFNDSLSVGAVLEEAFFADTSTNW